MKDTVLVVEDEPSIADNIVYALTTEGFEPAACGTGKDALEALKSGGISFVVLDLGLPDVNGFDLLMEIRKSSNVPIIVLTSRSEEVDRILGLELGADDYVVKPFSPRELTARIRTVLRRLNQSTEQDSNRGTQAAGEFSLDEDRRSISYRGRMLDLSRYEYGVLKTLMARPGKVYTREDLMDRAWEEPGMSLERTVDTHIKTIRQKLRAVDSTSDPIVTHRGVGYSLREQ